MTILLSACGGGGLYTNADIAPQSSLSQSEDAGTAVITKDAFLFASPYPARIIIPDIDGMRGTAFVVSTLNPSGVVAIDLDKTPYVLSQKFKGVISPPGSGLPNNLVIQSPTRAFMLTSSAVVDFNPTSGVVHGTTMLPQSLQLPAPLAISRAFDYDNDGDDDSAISEIAISSPGGMGIAGDTLWISTANYLRYAAPAAAAPGVVLRYTIGAAGLTSATPAYGIATGFNPTGITAVGNTVLVTNSGVIDIVNGEAVPQTPSSVDMWDATTGTLIANVPAGMAALSFSVPAVDAEGRFAYIGSTAFSEVFQLDIVQRTFTRNLTNPISLLPETTDYITGIAITPNNRRAFVGSFDTSSVFLLNLAASPITAFSSHFVVGFPKGVTAENPSGVNTGVGDIAIRPGTPGTDFRGPEVFILTGNPGTLVTIASQGRADAGADIHALSIAPAFLPLEVGKQATVTGDVTFADGRQLVNIHNQFTHPTTGQYLTLQWTSDNPAIATVSSSGLVVGTGAGITTIRAHVGKYSDTLSVAVHLGKTPPASSENKPANDGGNFEQPQPDKPADGGKLVVVNCKDIGESPYIDQVVNYAVGAYGGSNQNKLPNIIDGPPDGGGLYSGGVDTFSLGGKGSIIVAFNECRIADGLGVDFIVFENAFYIAGTTSPFSEPAVVGVSQDGVNFIDFPCDLTKSPTYPGCAGTHPVLSNPKNNIDPTDPAVAGGDQFDLATIGISQARFIRIVDQGVSPIVGANGTNGFDLDAIAIVHGTKPQ